MQGKTWIHYAVKILEILDENQAVPLSFIARELGVNTSYCRKILEILHKAGYIQVQDEPLKDIQARDERVRGRPPRSLVMLTPKGKEYRQSIIVAMDFLESAFRGKDLKGKNLEIIRRFRKLMGEIFQDEEDECG